jgi:hypothetical protein
MKATNWIILNKNIIYDTAYGGPFKSICENVNSEANARLIASAPELLLALELVLNNNKVMNAVDVETRRAAMNAIAKAKGEL